MKTEPRLENDPELRALLQEWAMKISLPPGFRSQVWRKVEQTQRAPTSAADSLFRLAGWLGRMVSRPALAVSYLTALIVLGGSVGWAQSQHRTARVSGELSHRYVQALDPYQTPR